METVGRGFGARAWGRLGHRDRKSREAAVRLEVAKVVARIKSAVRWVGAPRSGRDGRVDAHGHERAGIEAYKNAPK